MALGSKRRAPLFTGPKPKGHPEDTLQEQIVAFHRDAVSQRHAILFAVPNGEKRDPITAARLVGISAARRATLPPEDNLMPFGLGVLPGTADLVLVLPGGRCVFIELKTPEITWPPANLPCSGPREVLHAAGRQSREQKAFQAGTEALDHRYVVVRYLGEYADLLESLGVPLRRPKPWGPGITPPAPAVAPPRPASVPGSARSARGSGGHSRTGASRSPSGSP